MYSVKAKLACEGFGVAGVRAPLGVPGDDTPFVFTSSDIAPRMMSFKFVVFWYQIDVAA